MSEHKKKMTRIINSRTKVVVVIGLFTALCGGWALAPLWVNPCFPTHLGEDEIVQTHEFPNYENLNLEQQAKVNQLYREAEIPCGAQDLPLPEKLDAANWSGRILDELAFMNRLLILRFEMVDTVEHGGAYYFKAYTFFYIPFYRVFAGGSGYMEIDMLPFENDGLHIGEWK